MHVFVTVNAQQPHTAAEIGQNSLTETRQEPEHRLVGHLASLVEDVAARLETPIGDELASGLIRECTTALESCIDLLRDVDDRRDLVRTRDDLKRLGRLLKLVDGADVSFVLGQIRRVLGRFDAHGVSLLGERRGAAR